MGSFVLYNYGDIQPVTQIDEEADSEVSANTLVYVATIIEDQIYSLGEHVNDENQMQQDFPFERADIDLLLHTAGVTYPEFRTEMGFNPHSVFYDFAYQQISCTWYSRTDELFSDVTFATDFEGLMVNISFNERQEAQLKVNL